MAVPMSIAVAIYKIICVETGDLIHFRKENRTKSLRNIIIITKKARLNLIAEKGKKMSID